MQRRREPISITTSRIDRLCRATVKSQQLRFAADEPRNPSRAAPSIKTTASTHLTGLPTQATPASVVAQARASVAPSSSMEPSSLSGSLYCTGSRRKEKKITWLKSQPREVTGQGRLGPERNKQKKVN
jgi:hypothetical protein